MRPIKPQPHFLREFQSTPVIADERCAQDTGFDADFAKFQSTPVIADERCTSKPP